MNKLKFTPTEDDLHAAYRLHIQRVGWKRHAYFILFGAIVGIILAAFDGFENSGQAIGLIGAMMLWAAVVATLMQFLIPIFWIPRLAKKIYKQQKDLRLETETWWDDDKIHSRNAQGHSYFEFTDMVKWRADAAVILLYRSDHLFNFIPTRIFEDSTLDDALIRRLQDAGITGERK